MLVGNMDKEGNIVVGGLYAGLSIAKKLPGIAAIGGSYLESAANSFGSAQDIVSTTLKFFLRFVEDSIFNCPAGTAAAARAAHGVPVWRYRMMGVWDNELLGGYGAYHLADVPIVMGTTMRKATATPNDPEEEKLINVTMTAWATFAKDPENGLTELGWPKYDPNGK